LRHIPRRNLGSSSTEIRDEGGRFFNPHKRKGNDKLKKNVLVTNQDHMVEVGVPFQGQDRG